MASYYQRKRPRRPTLLELKRAGAELKRVDLGTKNPAFDTTGTVDYLLNGLDLGSSSWNRVGRRIRMTKLEIRGVYYPDISAASGPSYARTVVFYDKQCNGTIPTWGTIFNTTTFNGSSSNGPFSMPNIYNEKRFEILWDNTIVFGEVNVAGNVYSNANPGAIPMDHCIDLDHETTYDAGTAGDVTDINTGSLVIKFIATTSGVNASFQSRVHFYEV